WHLNVQEQNVRPGGFHAGNGVRTIACFADEHNIGLRGKKTGQLGTRGCLIVRHKDSQYRRRTQRETASVCKGTRIVTQNPLAFSMSIWWFVPYKPTSLCSVFVSPTP